MARALTATTELIPPGSLDFEGVAAELRRVARLIGKTDPATIDLCGLFSTPGDDEAARLLAQVARLLLATMSGDLTAMATGEIMLLLARHFLWALARRAGTDRSIPFAIGPDGSARDALTAVHRLLDDPCMEELAASFLARHTAAGTRRVHVS